MSCRLTSIFLLLGGMSYYLPTSIFIYFLKEINIVPYIDQQPISYALYNGAFIAFAVLFAIPLFIVCLAISENPKLAWIVAALYLALGIYFSSVSTYAYHINREQFTKMKWTLDHYDTNETKRSALESENRCCGYNGPLYYTWRIEDPFLGNYVPKSCTQQTGEDLEKQINDLLVWLKGCSYLLKREVDKYFTQLMSLLNTQNVFAFSLAIFSGIFACIVTFWKRERCAVGTRIIPPCTTTCVPGCITNCTSNSMQVQLYKYALNDAPCSSCLYRYQ